jgi:hypothetical protein
MTPWSLSESLKHGVMARVVIAWTQKPKNGVSD